MILFPVPLVNPDAVPELSTAVQEKAVPAVVLERAILVVPPEHNVCDAGAEVTMGMGFTVTTTVMADPVHPFADGIMEYITVAGATVLLVRVCAMLFPVPLVAPVILPGGATAMVHV